MDKLKSKHITIKILFSIVIILALMIMNQNVQAAPNSFLIGYLDSLGGDGIAPGPEPFKFGNYWCIDHSLPLVRRLNGSIAVFRNRKNAEDYYNQQINYHRTNTLKTEQSIVAAYYAYGKNGGTQWDFQRVVWSSGQWAGKNGYVNNLNKYIGTHQSSTANSSKVVARGEDWANFYYNYLKETGNDKVNIKVTPTDEKDIRVCVNQPDRTFIQGPYQIDLTDSSGKVMNNNSTQYASYTNIGTLVYNEILGKNVGEDIFQFCKVKTATTTVKYTDSSSEQKGIKTPSTDGPVIFLDESGNEIPFPEFGKKFYLKVPMGSETKAVQTIEFDFNLDYMTNISGTTTQYDAYTIMFEINNENLEKWSDSELKFGLISRGSSWLLNESMTQAGVNNVYDLQNYICRKIVENARKDNVKSSDDLELVNVQLDAYIRYASGNGNGAWGYLLLQDRMENGLNKLRDELITQYTSQNKNISSYEVVVGHTPTWTDEFGVEHGGHEIKEDRYSYSVSNPNTGQTASGSDYRSRGDASEAARSVQEGWANEWYNRIIRDKNLCRWNYFWHNENPAIKESTAGRDLIQLTAVFELEMVSEEDGPITRDGTSFHLIGTDCTVEIGGKVWEDIKATKESKVNGKLGSEDKMYGGIQVDLLFNGRVVASTSTDSNGRYHFYKLNALEKYEVRFTFNGQMYQQTYYKDDLSGGYSNAKEDSRSSFNDRFDKIDSSPNNYYLNGWHTAYGTNVKLRKDNGDYIDNGTDSEGNTIALMYIDAWNQFQRFATRGSTHESNHVELYRNVNENAYGNAYNALDTWMANKGVGSTDRAGVIQFIKDCMTTATTRKYPVYDYFVIEDITNPSGQSGSVYHAGRSWNYLYTSASDQSRNVDFGIMIRDTADLALQKDVYKTMLRVNGKTQTYMYNKKDENVDNDGTWNLEIRQSDYLYNGVYTYNREIRKSEYLYDGSIYTAENGGTSAKDLQVYVTYRIVIRNQSQTYATTINEIVDYYDINEYTFDGSLNGNSYTPHTYRDYDSNGNITREYINSYVGDRQGNKIKDLTITRNSTLGNEVGDTNLGNGYTPIYLSGITKPDGDDRLSTGELAYVYLTFKVNTHTDENGMPGRVQMDVDTNTGDLKGVGKRNLAEIYGYSTYYKQGITVPGSLGNDVDVSGQKAGSIDLDSSPGNLVSKDLRENGDLIIEQDPRNPNKQNPITTRAEDDSDKAPNIKLVFPENDNLERVVTGYVYEDERNTPSDMATVGNGIYDDGETKINGVTVQLVELVQAVDTDGVPTGSYLGEYVWNAKKWDGSKWVDSNSSNTSGSIRYYSGQKEVVSPIICGPGATAIPGYEITEDGRYAFKSLPTGDLFVRFIYGDTTQTTLTKVDGEGAAVANLLSTNAVDNQSGYISNSGLNAKSYNGQDYKSTAYQRNLTDGTSVNQSAGTHNGIDGYIRYDEQNYNIQGQGLYGPSIVNTTDGKDKKVMYYYNIGESSVYSGISDAKDVANIRENEKSYSRGIANVDGEEHQTLTNRRGEVLTSGIKVSSANNTTEQVTLLKELMTNTAMVAQTGIINTEVEYNTTQTNNQGDKNVIGYVIDDVDLGLEERPVSQLELNKEVTNLKITLANGSVMFDTSKSVTNLSFAKHDGHKPDYQKFGSNAYRLIGIILGNNTVSTPELITTYIDEELMYGARIELQYKFNVTNIGEVDYLDKTFYYTGKTTNTGKDNIATTSADKVIDYISNNLQYIPTNDMNKDWSIRTVQDLTNRGNTNAEGITDNDSTKQDIVNVKHLQTLGTYNTIVTTDKMGANLYPERVDKDNSGTSSQMVLSSTIVPDTGDDSMVYNNLVEIVQSSNTQGRRMKFSTPGNQQMADQSKDPGTPVIEHEQYTKSDLVTPTEIDADSSQKVLLLPPTGANKNYTLWIVIGITALVLIGGSVITIKKFLKK